MSLEDVRVWRTALPAYQPRFEEYQHASRLRFVQDHEAWPVPAQAPRALPSASPPAADSQLSFGPFEKTRNEKRPLSVRFRTLEPGASQICQEPNRLLSASNFGGAHMSKEKPTDDPRQQTDWGSHKQT